MRSYESGANHAAFTQCLPLARVWPGQKCQSCEHFEYACSQGLSAAEESLLRQRLHTGVEVEPRSSPPAHVFD